MPDSTSGPIEQVARALPDSQDDRETTAPPFHIHVTVWVDRDPEVYAPGLAPWLVQAALYEAADALAPEDDPSLDEGEGEDD